MKRGSIENLDGFLKTTEKIVKKRRWLANAFKQKSNIEKQNSKTVIINTLGNSGKEELPTSILAPTFQKDVKDVAIIGVDAYCLACQLKGVQVFAISIRDIEFQAEKEARPEQIQRLLYPKSIIIFWMCFQKKT